jgi:dephospho-CoA kinase
MEVKNMYEYEKSKEAVESILKSPTKIVEKEKIPASDSDFTYENGIKSWVGALFVDIVDSSKLFETANEDTARIIRSFCSEIISILKDDESINRRELAKIVFSSKENLKKQESIIHPKVNKIFNRFIDENPEKNIVLNATVLYKTPVVNRCDAIIFVKAPIITRFFRAKRRDNLPSKEIFKRFASQFKIFAKYKFLKTDIYSIWNIGKSNKLEKKLDKILKSIIKTSSQ